MPTPTREELQALGITPIEVDTSDTQQSGPTPEELQALGIVTEEPALTQPQPDNSDTPSSGQTSGPTPEELQALGITSFGEAPEGQDVSTGPQNQQDPLGERPASPQSYKRNDVLFGDMVTAGDIATISKKHGLPEGTDLGQYVELLGGNIEREGIGETIVSMGKSVVGQLQKSAGMNIPSLIFIESQEDAGLKAALYELRGLADDKQGVVGTLGQAAAQGLGAIGISKIVQPFVLGATGATSALQAAGATALSTEAVVGAAGVLNKAKSFAGAVTYTTETVANIFGGAVSGYAGSNERENQVQDAVLGAAFGAAFSAIPLVGTAVKGTYKGVQNWLAKADPLKDKAMQLVEQEAARLDVTLVTAQKLIVNGDFSPLLDASQLSRMVEPAIMQQEVNMYLDIISPEKRKALADEMRDVLIPQQNETKFIFQRKVEEDILDFASFIKSKDVTSRDTAQAIMQDVLSTDGGKTLGKLFESHLQDKAAKLLFKDGVIGTIPEASTSWNRIYDGFAKTERYTYTAMDRRLGTNATETMDVLSKAGNLFGNEMRAILPEIQGVLNITKKTNIDNKTIYRALEDSSFRATLSTEHKGVIDAWQGFFAGAKKRANDLGLPITNFVDEAGQTSYVPHQRLFGTHLLDKLTDQVALIKKETGIDVLAHPPGSRAFAKVLDNPEYSKLRDSIAYMRGGSIDDGKPGLVGMQEVQSSLKDIFRGKALPRDLVGKSTATSVFARELEAVPELIRNTDIAQLAVGWTNSTFKHIYFKDGLASMANIRNVAINASDERAAVYLQKYITDLTAPSTRDTVANVFKRAKTATYVSLSKKAAEGSRMAKAAQSLLRDDSDVISTALNQVYPNFLGFSPRATLQNLAQPFSMTVPELGYAYGTEHYIKAVRNLKPMDALVEQGHMQQQFSKEMQDVLRNAVEKGSPAGTTRKAMEKFNDAAMWMYGVAEGVNRRTISTMADNVAKDIMAGVPAAKRFVGQMDESSRRRLEIAVRDKSPVGISNAQEIVNKYLLGKTALNYDKASMSEFGRSVGPVLSAFTKWPTSMLGEALDNLEKDGATKGAVKTFAKYGVPYFAYRSINSLLSSEAGLDTKRPGPSQVLFGKKGLEGLSPAGNFGNILSGDLAPPVIQLPAGLYKKGVVKTMDDALNMFMPFGSAVRVVDDITQILDGSHFGRTPLKVLKEQGVVDKPKNK